MRRAALLLLAPLLCAQDTVPFDSGVVIRSNTNLVQVRVIVQDSQGRSVTGLQRSDFQIQDDRKPQPITFFSAERAQPAQPATASSAAAPSSDAASAAQGPSYSVLLLDWLNIRYSYRVQAQELLLSLLKRFQPRQRVAVYLLDHNPRLLCDFTDDTDLLHTVVERAGLEFGYVEDDPPGAGQHAVGNSEEQLLYWQNRALDTLQTFKTVAAHLAKVPGRKSLVWLTAGFPATVGGGLVPGAHPGELTFVPRLEEDIAKMNSADIAVYTVSACGLSMNCRSFSDASGELSLRTGGTVFAGRNDIDEGLRLALEDQLTGYTLGFNVPAGEVPGLHEIRVRVSRTNLKLRYRESYELIR